MGCCRSKSQKKTDETASGNQPLTTAIKIITDAQQTSPPYIVEALEKAVEILRATKLSSQQMSDRAQTDDDDDVLGTLLSQNTKRTSTAGPRSSNGGQGELQRLLEKSCNWDFDTILLEEITEKRPLVWAGMTILSRFRAAEILKTDETTLRNWLTLIEANYHPSNPYHTSTHSADVLQATAHFLSKKRVKEFLGPLDEIGCLIAAAIHDVDHPGRTNQYLINTGNALAVLYNDSAVLESHHAAFAFKLTLSDPRVNIFKNLPDETYKEIRKAIIDLTLATDMSKHFDHWTKFATTFQPILSTRTNESHADPQPDISSLLIPENKILIKRMLIKCADVSNPARPIKLCITWANRICEEYFQQTEDEIGRGLPPTLGMFDRRTCSVPKCQTGFVDFFITNMFNAWNEFVDVPEVIGHIKFNYNFWKDLESRGIQSPEQVNDYVRQMKTGSSSSSAQS